MSAITPGRSYLLLLRLASRYRSCLLQAEGPAVCFRHGLTGLSNGRFIRVLVNQPAGVESRTRVLELLPPQVTPRPFRVWASFVLVSPSPPCPALTELFPGWCVSISEYVEDFVLRSWGLGPRWPPLTPNLWCHVVAPHSWPLKKSLQAHKSSFSDAYVCVFVLYQSTRGPKDDKWLLSGQRQS